MNEVDFLKQLKSIRKFKNYKINILYLNNILKNRIKKLK